MTDSPGSRLTFTHTRLLVAEYGACFRFYRDSLGFEVAYGDEEGTYAEFETGSVSIALFDRDAMATTLGADDRAIHGDGSDRLSLVFAVESVDGTYRHLRERGVEFLTEPTDREGWMIRTAHLRDPDGTLIEINEPLA